MRTLVFAAIIATVGAANIRSERIVGGITVDISRYPYMVSTLFSADLSTYSPMCCGSIITTKSILTAAHCIIEPATYKHRIRVGSSYASSGGVVHVVESIAGHAMYGRPYLDNDVAVFRTTAITYIDGLVQPALLASHRYTLRDNEVVWPVGWGRIYFGGPASEELRHAQTWTVNQEICRQRYTEKNYGVTDNMVCSGWLDMGGRGQCHGDSGGPLVHNGVVVGITAWGYNCAHPRYPSVSMRVSRYISWIQDHADTS